MVSQKPTAELCISLSQIERQLGNVDAAKTILTDALRKCKRDTAKILLALAWIEEDAFANIARAEKHIASALQIDPTDVNVHIAYANMLIRQGKTIEARKALQASSNLVAEDGKHFTMWSVLESLTGNFTAARKILEAGAQKFPGDAFLLQRWGALEAKCGNTTSARELFLRSATIQPHAPTFVAWAILEEQEIAQVISNN